jgi:hypothetical protein
MYPQSLQRYRLISLEGFLASFLPVAFFCTVFPLVFAVLVFPAGAATFFTGALRRGAAFFFETAADFFGAATGFVAFFAPLFFDAVTAFAMILHHYGLP